MNIKGIATNTASPILKTNPILTTTKKTGIESTDRIYLRYFIDTILKSSNEEITLYSLPCIRESKAHMKRAGTNNKSAVKQ